MVSLIPIPLSVILDVYPFIAHEAAVHAAKLRVELAQSRTEQQDYLKNVELARVLDKRAERKKEKGEEFQTRPDHQRKRPAEEGAESRKKRRSSPPTGRNTGEQLSSMLGSVF